MAELANVRYTKVTLHLGTVNALFALVCLRRHKTMRRISSTIIILQKMIN